MLVKSNLALGKYWTNINLNPFGKDGKDKDRSSDLQEKEKILKH